MPQRIRRKPKSFVNHGRSSGRPWYGIIILFHDIVTGQLRAHSFDICRREAESLQVLASEKGKNIASDLKTVSVNVEIKQDEVNKLKEFLIGSGDLKSSGDEYCRSPDVVATDVPNLPFPQHCHRLVA